MNGNHLLEFLGGSDTFIGIVFKGMYTMPTGDFLLALKHFNETGKNVLDEYTFLHNLQWNYYYDGVEYFDKKQRKAIRNVFKNKGFWDVDAFINFKRREEIEEVMALSEAQDIKKDLYPARRRRATSYTGKKKIREAVFKKHGKICKNCGATEQIQIDHVIAVVNGGKNEIDNLQPLCKSCNSSKSGS